MAIHQLSVFVQNKPGTLVGIIEELANKGINIRASSIADTAEFGIFRLITNDFDKTREILSENNVTNVTRVIAAKMEDKPGALYRVVDALSEAGINIEYMYAFTASETFGAYVVFRVDDVDAAQKLLDEKGISTLNDEDILDM